MSALGEAKAKQAATKSPTRKSKTKPPRPADVMAESFRAEDLFHSPDGTPYAIVGRVCLKVESKDFRNHLARNYFAQTRKAASTEAIQSAVSVLCARAKYEGLKKPVELRYAAVGEKRYVALYDAENRVIEIDRNGWRECKNPPVLFKRPGIANALPWPEQGGSLDSFWKLVNVPDASSRSLLLGWMTAVVNGIGAAPVMILTGPQGSAKSTTMRMLQRLLDPIAAEGAALSESTRDLAVLADQSAVLAFDNLSRLSPELSDAFCRFSTGGAFLLRALYTNDELQAFEAQRPIILNGITDIVNRADLLDRSVIIRHPPLPKGSRKADEELNAEFEKVKGKLLGAIFTRVSGGLRMLAETPKPGDMRMLDFARFAVASESAAGETSVFVSAYNQNRTDSQNLAVEDCPVATAVVKLMEGTSHYAGTMKELYEEITPKLSNGSPPRGWPTKPNRLSAMLERAAPALREVHGIEYVRGNRSGGNGGRKVTISRFRDSGNPSSVSSVTTKNAGFQGTLTDSTDATDDQFQKRGADNWRDVLPPDGR